MVNLFGNGFIGKHFSSTYPCIVNDRNDLIPKSSDIFYLISTVDNYNLKINPYIDIETNLTLLIRVLENWRNRFPDGVFNFASSWFVYGNSGLPAKEDTICNPKGFYSITKHTAEQLLISYCEAYDLKYRILRFGNVLGPGDFKTSKKKNAAQYVINEMKNHRPVEIVNHGQFIRDYIHISDLVRAVNLILEKGDINSTYNVSNGIPTKFIEIVNYCKEFGSNSSIHFIESVVPVSNIYLNIDKLKLIGYSPSKSLKKIVYELYKN